MTTEPPPAFQPLNPLGEWPTNVGYDLCPVPCGLPADGDENLPPHSEAVIVLVRLLL